MSDRIMGVETEYAVSGIDAAARPIACESIVGPLIERAHTSLCNLPDEVSNGVYLANGSRLYIDHGAHPEVSTPECENPTDVVRYVRAGEQTLERLALEVGKGMGAQVAVYRCQVDYHSGATWGRHESHTVRDHVTNLRYGLVPHLCSRLLICGAGGFDNLAAGVEFRISPRVRHLRNEMSSDSTSNRGIFHSKDEPLAGNGGHRLHLLCGESLCSDHATWIKVGSTALVVAMLEAGACDPGPVALRDPLAAMRAFAEDVGMSARCATLAGNQVGALDIQRHYLRCAETQLTQSWMPRWAAAVCDSWRATLDRLDQGAQAVATRLDWAIKLGLFQRQAQRRGIAWEQLPAWNCIADRLARALGAGVGVGVGGALLTADVPRSPQLAAPVARLRPLLRRHRLDWDEFGNYLTLRDELRQLDTAFGRLGEAGIFTQLAAAGVLDHQVEGIDSIAEATEQPPRQQRARRRGELVRELAGNGRRYSADWQTIWDHQDGRYVDLSDPLAPAADWSKLDRPAPEGRLSQLLLERVRRRRLPF